MTPRNHIRPRSFRSRSSSGLLMGGVGFLLLSAASVTAQSATDIVTLDLRPHQDHVHAGSLVQVTDRDGYDNQPWHPLMALDELVGPFSRLALAPSGFRLAVVTQR